MARSLLAVLLLTVPLGAQDLPVDLLKQLQADLESLAAGTLTSQKFAVNFPGRYGARGVSPLAKAMAADARLREGGARALLALVDRRALVSDEGERALLETLQGGGPGAVYAAWALGSVCSTGAVDGLIKAADGGGDALVQACAVSLGLIGGSKAKSKLLSLQTSATGKAALDAVQCGLDLEAKGASEDRRSVVLALARTAGDYPGGYAGWLRKPAYAGIRLAIRWGLKDLAAEFRALSLELLARDKGTLVQHDVALRLVYAIHLLGGPVTDEEKAALKERAFLD